MPTASEPASIAAAADVLAEASRRGLSVSIERGGGDIVLSTRRLDTVLDYAAGDLTVTVGAGIRLSALDRWLTRHGQMLALDPPGDPTVGAAIAGDQFGPRVFRYGRPRDVALGVTLVLADGTIANAGGKVVKNVAGYDLAKLVCGSCGRLALVARASLRLHPRPEAMGTLVVPVEEPGEAHRLARELLHSPLVPSAVDLLWPGRVALLFEGSERMVRAQLERAQALVGGEEDAAVWDSIAERQHAARSRRAFWLGDLTETLARHPEALVRLGPTCFAYLPEPREEAWPPLAERVRAEFDPGGVLA